MKCFLGISLSNPYYSRANLVKYMKWIGLSNYELAFLIGDYIHKYTYSVFKDVTLDEALDVCLKMGENMDKNIKRASSKVGKNFNIYHWKEITKNDFYKRLKDNIYNEYINNNNFKKMVRQQVINNLENKINYKLSNNKTITRKDKYKLDKYVLEEITGLITMSEYLSYSLELYPGNDLFIIKKIYSGEFKQIFRNIKIDYKRKFLSIKFD